MFMGTPTSTELKFDKSDEGRGTLIDEDDDKEEDDEAEDDEVDEEYSSKDESTTFAF